MDYITATVFKGRLVEYTKAFIYRLTFLFYFLIYVKKFSLQALPVGWVDIWAEFLYRGTIIHIRGHFIVSFKDLLLKFIVFLLTNVENQFIAVQKIVHFVYYKQNPISFLLKFITYLVLSHCFFELIKRTDKDHLILVIYLHSIVEEVEDIVVYLVTGFKV